MDKKIILILLAPILLTSLAACHHAGYYGDHYDYSYYDRHYDYDDYFYYPNIAVYFRIHSGYYFYRHDGHWKRSRHLPKHIYLDHRVRRHLTIRDKKPHHKHHEHHNKYRLRREFHSDRKNDRSEREHNRKLHEKHRFSDKAGRRDR